MTEIVVRRHVNALDVQVGSLPLARAMAWAFYAALGCVRTISVRAAR